VLNDRTLAIIYLSNDPYTRRYDEDITNELRRALGPDSVVAVTGRPADRVDDGQTWRMGGLHDVGDAALALPFAVCAQLLGLHFSLALGKTPDNPFPAGEVNRVVQGVTIHAYTNDGYE
jgi:tagatose-6-phosphate ketose/aldose isomerase